MSDDLSLSLARYRIELGNGFWRCETCGAVVDHRGKHDDLHRRLDKIEKDVAYVRQLAEF